MTARLVQPYLERYLDASVIVLDNPAGASYSGQDQAAAASPNGLTLGELIAASDLYDQWFNLSGLNFNPAHVDMLGANTGSLLIWVSSPSSPYTSFSKLQAATAANPVTELTLNSGATAVIMRLFSASVRNPY